LKVLAKPWAEVLIDGDLVDTTPIGRPLPVSPGRHYVTFRHPNAPDEKRSIDVASGQTVVLDVTMRLDRVISPDAGRGSGSDAGDTP
jgi:serine/threonine-protein kinase